ncbi:MAG: alpha-2-macroglobulin family protein [Dysgonomonas sp.]
MRKLLTLGLIFLCIAGTFAQTNQKQTTMNQYDVLWKQVTEFENDDLPKSATDVVDKILKQAVAEKNTPQTIKALIHINKYKIDIDRQESSQIFADLENLLSSTPKVEDRALLHSMLSELYFDYYNKDSWTIDQRTNLGDFVPDNMNEWTKNIFHNKVIEHLDLSIKDRSSLEKTTTKTYQDIIILTDDSRLVYPTLYDFLMKRAIDQSSDFQIGNLQKTLQKSNYKIEDLAVPAADFYKLDFSGNADLRTLQYYSTYFRSLIDRNMDETIVLTELSKNNFLSANSTTYSSKYSLDLLKTLEKKYQSYDFNVEIIGAIIDKIYSANYDRYEAEDNENAATLKQVYDWCKTGIDRYPKYKRINLLTQKLDALESPYAEISGKKTFYPDSRNKSIVLKYKNLNKLALSIKDNLSGSIVKTQTYNLSPKNTYESDTMTINLDLDKIGNYTIITEFDKKSERDNNLDTFEFSITKLAYFGRQANNNSYEFYVVDRNTGKPINKADINIYTRSWTEGENRYTLFSTVKTDRQGIATYNIDMSKIENLRRNFSYRATLGNDSPSEYTDFPYSYYYSQNTSSSTKEDIINIFTDRSIYRPGQTVYFKAVAIAESDKDALKVIPGKEYKVSLYNANRQLISEKTLKTNDFGSISDNFVLPQSGLTGSYSLQIGAQTAYFLVEEYKRPTFQVTFDTLTSTYAFGDTVKIIGHAENFSGIKLQNATVEYTINRYSFFRWYNSEASLLENNEVTTKDDGSFEIIFTIPQNDNAGRIVPLNQIYNFGVEAKVTDLNGESQIGNYNFAVGNVSMILSTNIPEKLNRTSQTPIIIKASNLDEKEIEAKGSYTIYNVLSTDSIGNEISSGQFDTGKTFDLKEILKNNPSAKYCLRLKTTDDKERDVNYETRFVLYSFNDKKPPINTNDWLISKKTDFEEKEDAEIIIGISAKESTIMLNLMKDNEVLERQQFKLSNENKTLKIPYKSIYGDGISAAFTYVVDEVAYQKNILLNKKSEVKELDLKFKVFRNKLRPGQNEEWRISVKDNANKPAIAELLASMYDTSLDKLSYPSIWIFDIPTKRIDGNNNFQVDNSFATDNKNIFYSSNYSDYPDFQWDHINWFGFDFYQNSRRLYRMSTTKTSEQVMSDSIVDGDLSTSLSGKAAGISFKNPSSTSIENSNFDDVSDESFASDKAAPMQQIRSNFNETAFFYPQLRTNEKGETSISFVVPESNTTWKFRALAYDKSLNIGQLEAIAISRKELMVTPNIPRFVREGDLTSISTKISNLSDNVINGKVRLEFFNPLTNEVQSIALENQYQPFSLNKDASSSVSWLFKVPANADMLGCRIIAESESFSDGEQHVISILPNRMLVTESMTMNVNGMQSKDFVFDKFVNNKSTSLSNYRLTLEYAGNPAWYAIQALPTLSNPTNENAVNWFASYYVNTLGAAIMKQYPKVNAMISTWKKQGGDKETLVSKLQQNEELKAVLLEETPWVLDAKDETEQMNRLSSLFDLNNTKMLTDKAIEKLLDLQQNDGGWSWYKGMYSNRSTTQYILYGFANLIRLNAVEYSSNIKTAQIQALRYIDKQIATDFDNLKRYDKNWQKLTSISTNQLEYLYVRSSYRDIPIDDPKTRDAERFYTSVVEKNWTKLNLYERSLLAVLTQRNGNKELTSKLMQSLREHATTNEEMGMFWANNTSHAFMSQSAVTVHSFIMDAFETTKASDAEMDKMKQWLLKQKQTQAWESTHATIDAISALLSTGSNWFADSGQSAIKIGNQEIKPQNKTLGTNYFKESWTGVEIKKDMGKVNIQKSDNGPAWGTLYWQYFEDLDKITLQKGELNVDKKLFVVKNSDKGETLVQITENAPIRIGDKVVVLLTVKTDRDMDFVHLKDMRASCFEPIETLSGIKWQNNTYYYQSTKDASTNFFFDFLAKGTYVFEYTVFANRSGEYSNGITSIQCMYAPEFTAHTNGIKVTVK